MTEPSSADMKPPAPRGRGWAALGAMAVVYLALFAWFAPGPAPRGPEDALVLKRAYERPSGNRETNPPAPDPAPLRSVFAAGFAWVGGSKAAPFAGAFIHILAALACARLLARLGVGPLWAALVLFQPTLTFASRIALGDELGGALLALAAIASTYPEPGSLRAGICAALSLGSGPAALAAIPALAVGPADEAPERRRERLVNYALGAAAALFALGCYHFYSSGTPFGWVLGSAGATEAVGSARANEDGFSRAGWLAFTMALFGVPALLTFLIDRSRMRRPTLALCAFFFLQTLFRPPLSIDAAPGLWWIAARRPLIPILPVWFASLAAGLDRVARSRPTTDRRTRALAASLGAAGLGALVFITGWAFRRDRDERAPLDAARAELVRLVPAGSLIAANPNSRSLLESASAGAGFRWFALTPATDPADLAEVVDLERGRWFVAVAPGAERAEWEPLLARFEKAFNLRRVIDKPNLIVLESPEPTAVADSGGSRAPRRASPPAKITFDPPAAAHGREGEPAATRLS